MRFEKIALLNSFEWAYIVVQSHTIAQILTKALHSQQITSWTHALPDTVISHLFGKVRTEVNYD